MADKYLSEKEWKSTSKGSAWKAEPLAKALAAFEKADQGEPAGALAALDEVEKQAVVLGKTVKGDKALSAWLGGLDKSVSTSRRELDKAVVEAAKAAEKAKSKEREKDKGGEEEDEDAAEALLLDPKRRLQQLNLLKKDPERRVHFGFVAAGDKCGAVLTLSPKISGRKLFGRLQEATGQRVGAYGEAWLDGKTLVLQLDKPMSGLVKKVREPIRECGFRVSKVVLWDADGTVLEESVEEAIEAAEAAAEGGTGAAAPAAEASPTDAPAAEAEPAGDPRQAQFQQRMTALAGPLQQALAGGHPAAAKLRELLGFARDKAASANFAAGLQALEVLGKLLGATPAPAAEAPAAAAAPDAAAVPPRAEYTRCSKAWSTTRSKVAGDIGRLRQQIMAEAEGLPLADQILAKVGQLDGLLTRFDEQLDQILDRAEAAAEDERIALHRQAAASIRKMLAQLDSDPLLPHLKDNPFLPIDPRALLNGTLQVLARQVA